MADTNKISDIRYFNVYDSNIKKLKYSKYNFNFELYKKDFQLENKTKLEIFDHFLIANDTAYFIEPDYDNKGDKTPSYLKPTTLKDKFIKYFKPMTNVIINYNNKYAFSIHPNYMMVQNPPDYVSTSLLVKQQFDLVFYKDIQLRRLQDFYYSDNLGIYSKYNFNFNLFSKDFNVYGNKLVVFTDFISRVLYSSGVPLGIYGYGIPKGFRKYFIQTSTLIDYMNKYGTTSVYKNVAYKNENSIDYKDYALKENLGNVSIEDSKENYIRKGQFTQVELKFIEEPLNSKERNINSICTIFASNGMAAGFLYKNSANLSDTNIYVVTVSHVFSAENLSTFFASFTINDNSRNNNSTTALFKVIGRDKFSDICLGVYDPELPYNQSFKPDLSIFKNLKINLEPSYKIGDNLYTCGNLGNLDNKSLIKGSIIDPRYTGSFNVGSTYVPESLLIDIDGSEGLSGSPVFLENNDEQVIGMILGMTNDKFYSISLTSFYLESLVSNIIARYSIVSVIYKNNPLLFELSTSRALTRRWLGCKSSYFNNESSKLVPSLLSFPETGGLILHDFILGFNYNNKQYIYDTISLQERNVIKLDGPLLNSKMYNRFIQTGKTPIVLKSITFQQGFIGQFAKYEFGKFGNQDGYYNFTFGLSGLGSRKVPKEANAANGITVILGKLYFEYYYFNGISWNLEKEEINDDSNDFYTVYTDNLGNRFYESKWSFPTILYNYDTSYINLIKYNLNTKIDNKNNEDNVNGFDNTGAQNVPNPVGGR